MAGTAPAVSVQIEGLEELEDNLLVLPEDLAKRALGNAGRTAMKFLQRRIAGSAPVKTGRLERGIQVRSKFISEGALGGTIIVSIGLQLKPKEKSAFYGKFVELGTVRIKTPHPFMKPEFDAWGQEIIKLFAQELGTAIETTARRAKIKL